MLTETEGAGSDDDGGRRGRGRDDGGVEDGGVEDGGVDDGGVEDGGVDDGGVEDGGVEDGGVEDGGVDDGGVEDGGVDDGGVEDGGVDECGALVGGADDWETIGVGGRDVPEDPDNAAGLTNMAGETRAEDDGAGDDVRGLAAGSDDAEAGEVRHRCRAGLRLQVAGRRGVVGADQGEGGHGRARHQSAGEAGRGQRPGDPVPPGTSGAPVERLTRTRRLGGARRRGGVLGHRDLLARGGRVRDGRPRAGPG